MPATAAKSTIRAMKWPRPNLAHFVPPNASLQKTLAQDEQPLPLHAKSIVPFLYQSPAQVLLLHGDAGAGKSLYGRFLEKALWAQYPPILAETQTAAYTIPLFISLPALQDPTQNPISQALQQYGWDKATITYFKQQLAKKSISKPNHIDDDDDHKMCTRQRSFSTSPYGRWGHASLS